MNAVFGYAVWFAQICIAAAMVSAAVRLFIGPAAQDRVLAFDSLYMNGMLMLLILGIRSASAAYFDMALLMNSDLPAPQTALSDGGATACRT